MNNVKTVKNLFEVFLNKLTPAHLYEIELSSQISATISIERVNRKMEQKEFAKFMNVSQKTVSNWESGDYNFTIRELCEICAKLGLTLSLELKAAEEGE